MSSAEPRQVTVEEISAMRHVAEYERAEGPAAAEPRKPGKGWVLPWRAILREEARRLGSRPRVGAPLLVQVDEGVWSEITPCSGHHRALHLCGYLVLSCKRCTHVKAEAPGHGEDGHLIHDCEHGRNSLYETCPECEAAEQAVPRG